MMQSQLFTYFLKTSLLLALLISPLVIGCSKEVRVNSNPLGADIYSQGRPLGKTPLLTSKDEIMPNWNFDGIIPTRAVVTAKKAGYEDAQKAVTEFDLPDEIMFDLVPVSLADHFENYLEQNPSLVEQTIVHAQQPVIQTSHNLDADSANLFNNGYLLVAYSGFSAEGVVNESIRQQAMKVGAAVGGILKRCVN
ncbi:MAG: hypothetical protein GYA55_12460 [SAR324 cluster bacterium]|uniref:PEGA domain-containing protein n=1 Tax=SAR324 cluster bacterium TaxID=2024889 RepID=A0A7X9FTM8_9DELT|nr:hypothetical protein [SAR324 cluster bacterium]